MITFTRNSAEGLRRLLRQVAPIVDEIIVVDGFSTDDTVDVALSYGAKVFLCKPWGYADPDRMFALRKASGEWILYLDTDEILCPRLRLKLREIVEQYSANKNVGGFVLPRFELDTRNKTINVTDQIRLYRRERAYYKGLVNELPEIKGSLVRLPYKYCIAHLNVGFDMSKWMFYAHLEALEYVEHRARSHARRILWKLAPISSAFILAFHVLAKVKLSPLGLRTSTLQFSLYRGLYESIVHTLTKFRSKKRRRIAEAVSKHGLTQLLKLDEGRTCQEL
jgi:(heptosyl)LPS beta-1,4-glucosyltransferase